MVPWSIISGKWNVTSLIRSSRNVASVAILTILISTSPFLSRTASAETKQVRIDWVRLARELFVEFSKVVIRETVDEFIKASLNELNVPQPLPFDIAISKYIAGRRVDFSNEMDGRQFSGIVIKSGIQRNSDTSESGAAGAISWEDGAFSTILFLENRRVRIWSSGKEYGGDWIAKNNVLYVRTDIGSLYRFY
ncbi:hypothetical protein TUMEXPCC7403_20735 [Tumidithrix helvetica PCC 7403]|uniref:hypothetical protein n=1 Tax=Tumidithrix helvetica TaxID=3457545 RepID=UPI003C88BD37